MPGKYITPPAPDWPDSEIGILAELEDGELAVELWLVVRKARLFAKTPPGLRSGLFHRHLSEKVKRRRKALRVEIPPELEASLQTFADLTSRRPVDAAALAAACAKVAEWAAQRSLEQTAVHFARAAAAVAPDDPTIANLSALMYRRAGDWKRAEQFYARAIGLAREHDNKIEYICGHIGSAALLYARGVKLRRAVKHLRTAARKAAKEKGSLWLASHALHDSMLLLVQREQFPAAEIVARRAAELYPLHDSRFPFFVADFAFVQLEQNRHSTAAPLLQLCLRTIEEPAVRCLIMSLLARAYAGIGITDEFHRYRHSAIELAKKYGEHAPTIHYHLAEGARACRLWPDAERHARRARQLAIARGDGELVRLARRSLRFTAERESGHSQLAPSGSPLEQLAHELAVRLRRWNRKRSEHGSSRRTAFRNQWLA
jgi:tetratricopeptide (TPR) repeat protein